jgi:hypothetical protein
MAMMIGIKNMKRRRIRTTLTTATVVLVVFTMLAFSSVSKTAAPIIVRKSHEAPYNGLFYHWPAGKAMDEETLVVLKNMFADHADLVVRRIMTTGSSWPLERAVRDDEGGENDQGIKIRGAVGLPTNDQTFLESMPLLYGRHFSSDDAREVILPSMAAEGLHLSSGDVGETDLRFQGETLRLVGIADDQRLRLMRDLNPNLPLLPYSMEYGRGGQQDPGSLEIGDENIGSITVDTSALLLLPERLAAKLGARPHSVSVRFREDSGGKSMLKVHEEMASLLTATRARFYVGSREPFKTSEEAELATRGGVYYVGSSYRTSIGGLSRLFIPLLIAGTIILNTMLGTVYERRSEIAIYNAVGLNPTHIFLFFLAEAFVYSFIGSVGGYLIGQFLSVALRALNVVKDINVNFSSLMVVYAILFTIGLVLLSTVYPGYVAARTAVPSGRRRWSLPDHDGQTMRVALPFIYQPRLAAGVMYYLYEYFLGYTEKSLGDLIATFESMDLTSDEEGRPVYSLVYSIALAPFDLGVTQQVTFGTRYDDIVQSYRLHMVISRTSGQDTNWAAVNKSFLEKTRRFLIGWRKIGPTLHAWYAACSEKLFSRRPTSEMPAKPEAGQPELGPEAKAPIDGALSPDEGRSGTAEGGS